MYTLTFTLKQHTPIIHFQHDQDGATLRATEVKPKLDRFIIEKLTNKKGKAALDDFRYKTTRRIKQNNSTIDNPSFKQEWLNMLVGNNNDHLALDYKIKVIYLDVRPVNERKAEITIIPPNIDYCLVSNKLTVEINVTNQTLKQNISNFIEGFFISNSFGKRNNKGFGCFYTEPDNNVLDWNYIKSKLPSGTFFKEDFFQRNIENPDFSNEYKRISDLQRILKSGINLKNRAGQQIRYIKSKLFVYSINRNMRWDKRWIKKELKKLIDNGALPLNIKYFKEPNDWCSNLDINTNNGRCSYNNWTDSSHFSDSYFFLRILLGLSEHWEFLTTDRNLKYKVIPENDDIERYKSPLSFKVFGNNVFVFCDEIESEIYNKPFRFKVQMKRKNDNRWEDEGSPIYFKDASNNILELFTPNEFNFTEFLNLSLQSIGFTQNN